MKKSNHDAPAAKQTPAEKVMYGQAPNEAFFVVTAAKKPNHDAPAADQKPAKKARGQMPNEALFAAAAGPSLEKMKKALEKGADWKAVDERGCTVLHQFAANGFKQMFKDFLKVLEKDPVKFPPDQVAELKANALAYGLGAAIYARKKLARMDWLIAEGADPARPYNNWGDTALYAAAKEGEQEILTEICNSHRWNWDQNKKAAITQALQPALDRALIEHVEGKNFLRMKWLLEQGANPLAPMQMRGQLLSAQHIMRVRRASCTPFELLLANRINDICVLMNEYALYKAFRDKDLEAVKQLLQEEGGEFIWHRKRDEKIRMILQTKSSEVISLLPLNMLQVALTMQNLLPSEVQAIIGAHPEVLTAVYRRGLGDLYGGFGKNVLHVTNPRTDVLCYSSLPRPKVEEILRDNHSLLQQQGRDTQKSFKKAYTLLLYGAHPDFYRKPCRALKNALKDDTQALLVALLVYFYPGKEKLDLRSCSLESNDLLNDNPPSANKVNPRALLFADTRKLLLDEETLQAVEALRQQPEYENGFNETRKRCIEALTEVHGFIQMNGLRNILPMRVAAIKQCFHQSGLQSIPIDVQRTILEYVAGTTLPKEITTDIRNKYKSTLPKSIVEREAARRAEQVVNEMFASPEKQITAVTR